MERMESSLRVRPSLEAHSYLKYLINNGAFKRMIDPYIFAAAYAIKNNLSISPVPSQSRQDLINIDIVEDDIRLALEASIYIIRKRNGELEPKHGKEVLEILTQYAEAGLKVLKQRWEGKVSNQIQDDIRRIISSL